MQDADTPDPQTQVVSADRPPPKRLPTPGQGVAWGIGFFVIYLVASVVYGAFAMSIFIAQEEAAASGSVTPLLLEHLQTPSGIAGLLLTQALFLAPALFIASNFKTQNWRETLALKPVPLRSLTLWVGIFILYTLALAAMDRFVDVQVDPFIEMMQGARHLGLAIAIVTLAPLVEEAIFRGYLFAAWRHSKLGLHGTVLVTSGLFLLAHLGQYNWIVMTQLFVLALIFGYARARTGSLLTPIILHALNNLLAAIFIIFLGPT